MRKVQSILIICYLRSVFIIGADQEFSSKFLRIRNLPFCNEDQLLSYLVNIQVINPENIINMSTAKDVDLLCRNLHSNLITINKYLQSCDPPHQKHLYIQLIRGVDSLYHKVCTKSAFNKTFKRHYSCLKKLQNDFQNCKGPADWIEISTEEEVCKVYQDIMNCYVDKTNELCGSKAAVMIQELILAIMEGVLVIKCDLEDNMRTKENQSHKV